MSRILERFTSNKYSTFKTILHLIFITKLKENPQLKIRPPLPTWLSKRMWRYRKE